METIHPPIHPAKRANARRHKRYSHMQLKQIAIILVFIFIATLISVLLPVYFAYLPIAGG